MNILFICRYLETSATNTCIWVVAQEAVAMGHHCAICSFQGCVYDSDVDANLHLGEQPVKKKYTIINQINDYLHAYRPLRSIRKSEKCNDLRRVVIEKAKSFNPDVIVASLQPIESVIVGQEIKEMHLKDVVYVPYMLDAIFACKPLSGMPKWLYRLLALYREKSLFREAEAIVMMRSAENEYQNSFIKPSYFSKITFLDIPFYKPVAPVPVSGRKYFPKDQKVLFYAGTMPRSIRDPRFFMRVFSNIRNSKIHVYFAGSSGFMSEIEEFIKNDNRLHFLGMLDHKEVIERVCEADVMLNFGNHFKGMMPSKIFEYISARKPIISTYFIDDDHCNDYLTKYGAALLLDERNDENRSAKIMEEFLNSPISVPGHEVLDLLYHDNSPAVFVEFLEKQAANL